jgi:hypothetical protein
VLFTQLRVRLRTHGFACRGKRSFCSSRKGFTEPVALSSTASIDLSPSGLAAFRVQPLETTSTYSRSVLGARGNLAIAGLPQQTSLARGPQGARKASLLLVALDDPCSPELGLLGVETGVAERAALAQQVPALVSRDLDLLEPLAVGVGRLAG